MRKVWFQLVDVAGNELSSAASIKSTNGDDIDDFRKEVKKEYANKLAQVDAGDLVVYANRAAFDDENRQPLEEDSLIGTLGGSKKDALVVEVPQDERDVDREYKKADTGPALKKARHGDHRELATAAKRLMSAIHRCNCDEIFEIESFVELPFPSLLAPPNRFQLSERAFKYQARLELKPLYDKVVSLWLDQRPITVNVAGTIGYGKSHMLAVLVLLLLKNPITSEHGSVPFVCYIPDCRELMAGESKVVTILQQNILLNIPDFTGPLNTIEDICTVMWGRQVILVADQWNSIDDEDSKCQAAKDRLGLCLGTSAYVEIHGMAMNASTWRELLPKQTSANNNVYYGGFNDDEFGVWLEHHPAIFTEHEEELALLTGKVPLLLSVFARKYGDGDSWKRLVQCVQQDEIVEDWMRLLVKFYESMEGDKVWKVCTLSVDWLVESTIVDFRFFYQDRRRGFCATSEIVLRLLYRVWSEKSADDALLTRWPSLLKKARNRSVLGFDVEEIIKAQICQQGVVGKYPRLNGWTIKTIRFDPGTEKVTLDLAIQERAAKPWWILLDPKIFNYAGVDMILVTDTTLVGINVTIAKTHSPLAPFFKVWRPLAVSKNMAIKGLFVAPDNFVHEEENVATALLRDVYHELWEEIRNVNQLPIQDATCTCTTGCGTKRCGCRRHGKLCNSFCECHACTNATSTS